MSVFIKCDVWCLLWNVHFDCMYGLQSINSQPNLISDNHKVVFSMSMLVQERLKALAMPKREEEEDVVTLSSGGEVNFTKPVSTVQLYRVWTFPTLSRRRWRWVQMRSWWWRRWGSPTSLQSGTPNWTSITCRGDHSGAKENQGNTKHLPELKTMLECPALTLYTFDNRKRSRCLLWPSRWLPQWSPVEVEGEWGDAEQGMCGPLFPNHKGTHKL